MLAVSKGPNNVDAPFLQLRARINPVLEMLYVFRIPDNRRNPKAK
jgi:hypothetical protein